MNPSIPGYYYDPEKRRYFKVEKSKTAPTTAAWSADNVKRRKLDDAEAAAALRRLDLTRNRIKRARVLNEPLTGGFFAREHGEVWDDLQPACFATGLKEKGSIPLSAPGFHGQVKHMYIDGQDDRTGMCTIWATVDERTLLTTYIPRDKDNRLNSRLLANYHLTSPRHQVVFTEFITNELSDIRYDAHSNQILFTCRSPGLDSNILWACAPEISTGTDERIPHFSLPTTFFESLPIQSGPSLVRRTCQGNCVSPASANSSLVCAVGTNYGVVKWARDCDHLSWLTPEPQQQIDERNHVYPAHFRDIFTVDFHPTNNSVLRFGGRRGVLVSADTRTPWSSWSNLQLPSAITHIRNLNNENQILVAGLQNSLGVYDMRFVKEKPREEESRLEADYSDSSQLSRPSPQPRPRAGKKRSRATKSNYPRDHNERKKGEEICRPVVLFENYRNNAHIDIGFAYDASTGLVAAAQDNESGTVALYSVRTGAKVRTLDFTPPGTTPVQQASVPIIRSLQFQTFPRDHMPTLFVGAGPDGGVTAYSFGVDDLDDEE
ncbi:hypothetical protein GGR57DRAFT_466860 [Xylariaceae sp. FL1272]|nr:hypothetical protein GGR57DRAFT_466860 [Xylariaceae sp. FL1272]